MAALFAMSPLKEVPADLHLLDAAQAGKLRVTDPLKSFVKVGLFFHGAGLDFLDMEIESIDLILSYLI